MKDTLSLYAHAERKGIEVIRCQLPATGSMSVQDDAGRCYVGIDERQLATGASERVHLAHELGHCETGSFYNRCAPQDIRQKHENRADKWGIRCLISAGDLDTAIAAGHTDIWDLAEYFSVTEDFMRKVVCLYTYGNTATELYF